jgi:hypothetical protein
MKPQQIRVGNRIREDFFVLITFRASNSIWLIRKKVFRLGISINHRGKDSLGVKLRAETQKPSLFMSGNRGRRRKIEKRFKSNRTSILTHFSGFRRERRETLALISPKLRHSHIFFNTFEINRSLMELQTLPKSLACKQVSSFNGSVLKHIFASM